MTTPTRSFASLEEQHAYQLGWLFWAQRIGNVVDAAAVWLPSTPRTLVAIFELGAFDAFAWEMLVSPVNDRLGSGDGREKTAAEAQRATAADAPRPSGARARQGERTTEHVRSGTHERLREDDRSVIE